MTASPSLRDRLTAGRPLVAVPLTDAVPDVEVAALAAGGLDVAELRIDLFSAIGPDAVLAQVRRLAAVSGASTLATIRGSLEGGSWSGSEAERAALYQQVIPLVDGIDIELSSTEILGVVIAAARAAGIAVIVSTHDFERTPGLEDLRSIAASARAAGADVVKVATMADTADDLRTLAAFVLAEVADARPGDAAIAVVGMGNLGPASRITLPLLGSCLTFASHGAAVAPGQLTFARTRALLDQLSG
jgi:3-dehydroquinate dehydratase-1